MSTFLSRFLNYMYKGELENSIRTVESFEVEVKRTSKKKPVKTGKTASSKEAVLGKIVVSINRVLTFVCLASFVAMVMFSFVYPNEPVPDTMQNSFFMTLGWFGSAFANYFQIDQERRGL